MKTQEKTTDRPKTATNKSVDKKGHKNSEDLRKIFEDLLKDIYWAEKHLTKALPKMSKAASSEELKQGFTDHLAQTEEHVSRIEQIFESLGMKPQAKKCEAMEGLVKEGEEAIEDYEEGVGRDAALIVAGQKVEHYEIAAYGSLKAQAKVMGLDDCVELLDATLQEEGETDKRLSKLSGSINEEAYSDYEVANERE